MGELETPSPYPPSKPCHVVRYFYHKSKIKRLTDYTLSAIK
jgi:hypothetical protein